jgi:CRP-like cAMP-binding protein
MVTAIQTIDFDHKKGFLRKQTCFTPLNDREISELASMLVEKHIEAGTTIVSEGDLVDSVYLIISGNADVRTQSVIDGKLVSKSVASMKAGDAIGLNETGFYSLSGRRTATVVSNSDMIILQLSVAAFHGFSLAHSRVNHIMRKQAQQFLRGNKIYEG